MRNDTRTYLSPEDKKEYQLAEEWIQQRIKAGESVGMEGLRNLEGMKEQIVREMHLAGLAICQAARMGMQS